MKNMGRNRQAVAALLLGVGLLLSLIYNLPLMSDRWLPVHDSLKNYQMFSYFYANFAHTFELPAWMPYHIYGMETDFLQWERLRPSSYLVGVLGALLGIKNAFLLFKVALVYETLLFAFGLVSSGSFLEPQNILVRVLSSA